MTTANAAIAHGIANSDANIGCNVTLPEMKLVKHPFKQGVAAQEGIEF